MSEAEPTAMDLIQYRLGLKVDKPNGKAWYGAYQVDVRHLIEQLEALNRAIVNSGCKAKVDEALTARYYQAPNTRRA